MAKEAAKSGGKPVSKNTMGGKADKGVKAAVKEGADHKSIHPKYEESTITCLCGNVIHTRSTKNNIRVEICSSCHPFFTGKHKLLDTAGRVEKFQKRYAKKS